MCSAHEGMRDPISVSVLHCQFYSVSVTVSVLQCQCYSVSVTVLQCYSVTVLQCYSITVLQCQSVSAHEGPITMS